jgi:hypothetical protein
MFESRNVFSGNKGTREDFDDWNLGFNSTSNMGNKEFDRYKASDFLKAYQICMSGLN